MPAPRRPSTIGAIVLSLTMGLAGCGGTTASPTPDDTSASSTDLSAIACATTDPDDVGELTGAWAGNDTGVYYIRQVGDCVWWFGTELDDIESGVLGQPGFANVASGRVDGETIVVEWADLPAGDVLGGGGLTLAYDEENDQLAVVEQRGEWLPFGATLFTRIDPDASPDASPDPSPSASTEP